MKLTTELPIVPTLRISGAIPLVPICAFMACAGLSLDFYTLLFVVALLVEALRYKPEGRGFDFRWCHWNFSLT